MRRLVTLVAVTLVSSAELYAAPIRGVLPRVPDDHETFRRPVAIERLDENTAVVANRNGLVTSCRRRTAMASATTPNTTSQARMTSDHR